MKKRENGLKVLLGAFAALVCLSLVWFVLPEHLTGTENHENRKMSAMPRLTRGSYRTFAADFTDFFNDAMPLRDSLITLNSAIDYFVFRQSPNASVIPAAEDWLFYGSKEDGDPIGCYQGTNLLTKEELEQTLGKCLEMRELMASQGRELVIFIAPNKERIYSEYMPERYGEPAAEYQALQIVRCLEENTDIPVVYPYQELMDAKEDVSVPIWYKTDTHWNFVGGYVGASALIRELGIAMPALGDEEIRIVPGEAFSGDLAGLMGLSDLLRGRDTEYRVEGYDLNGREELEWDFNGMARYHAPEADPRSIYVIRDSFSTHMADYIGSQFADSFLRHRNTYTYEDLEKCAPDIVVFEVSERNAQILKDFSLE